LLVYSLLETLGRHDLFGEEVKPTTARWLADVNQLGLDLKGQKLTPVEWQAKVEELFSKVELPDLLRFLDFERLTAGAKLVDNGALNLRVSFPKVEGLPTEYVFGRQIFALKKDRSVVPHGHDNMATAFLILGGNLRGRHYDRVQDEKEHMIIKPTMDREYAPGEPSSISDVKNNVHWFQALSEPAYIFNIHVLSLNPDGPAPTGRVYIDPQGEQLADGLIRAKRIGYKQAHQLYG
jgi:hypothetical protein